MPNEQLNALLQTTPEDDLYVLVRWPEVQELMEHNWFRSECLLYNPFDDQVYLDSAYFVPAVRLAELKAEQQS
ncbi:hypothetical protein [Mucilaginibacter sp.]